MLKQIYYFLSPKFQNLFLDYKVTFKPRYGHGNPPHAELNAIINSERNEYKRILNRALIYKDQFFSIKQAKDETNKNFPGWNNGFLPGLDIIGLYTIVSEFKPNKYLEIGSGNSTKVVFKAKKDQKLQTKIISIDPYPRAEIDHLADELHRVPFENIDFTTIDQLEENDILFIDNSHRILPNSDAMVCFLEILPRLKKGVIVHIHDIYWPYDYPQFMCDRFYSEQYGLGLMILCNPNRYKTILPNYFISEDNDLKTILNPIWENASLKNVEQHGGSYWLKIGS